MAMVPNNITDQGIDSVSVIDLPEPAGTVSVIDLPQTNTDVSIVNEQGKVETKPETATQQNIQGVQKPTTPKQTTPTQTIQPQGEPDTIAPATSNIKTNESDVLVNFSKYMGRPATTEEDMKNVEYLTTLAPAEVERRLKESGRQAQLDTIKVNEEKLKAEEDKKVDDAIKTDLQKQVEQDKLDEQTRIETADKDLTTQIADIRASNLEELNSLKSQLATAKTTLSDKNKAVVDSITATFDRRIAQQEQINKALLAGERVRGFTSGRARYASSLQDQIIRNEESAGLARIADLEAQKMAAVSQAELSIAQFDFEQLNKNVEKFEAAQEKQINELLTLNEIARQQEQLNLQKMQEARSSKTQKLQDSLLAQDIMSKTAVGETFEWDGETYIGTKPEPVVERFFSSDDLVGIMKGIEKGQTETIVDPNTGETYNLKGLADTEVVTATDDRGAVTIIKKNTGEIISKVSGVGKTKTQAANISLSQQSNQAEDLMTAIAILEANIGNDGKYDTDKAIDQVIKYSAKNPGKADQLIDAIKYKLNTDNEKAKLLITGKLTEDEDEGDIGMGLLSGGTTKITESGGTTKITE